jgi:hypothetical protein
VHNGVWRCQVHATKISFTITLTTQWGHNAPPPSLQTQSVLLYGCTICIPLKYKENIRPYKKQSTVTSYGWFNNGLTSDSRHQSTITFNCRTIRQNYSKTKIMKCSKCNIWVCVMLTVSLQFRCLTEKMQELFNSTRFASSRRCCTVK